MTFDESMERWEGLRGTNGGTWVLDEMKRLNQTTKTDEGKRTFADLVEQALSQTYGYPWGMI